jgi:aspartate carbamoyltransferase regulatory subunit
MSLKPSEIEDIIAMRFGELKDGNKFTVEYLTAFIDKMKEFDVQKKLQLEKDQEAFLVRQKKTKPSLICKNPTCRNEDETEFEKDERIAQITCKVCGTVASERLIHDGEWKRKFEGEVNPSFHGPAPDFNFSSSHNLQTGAIEIPGQGKKQARELSLTQKKVELNLSNMLDPKKEKKTRVGYKDQMKSEVFEVMQEIADSIQLHGSILQRAKTVFAEYRTDVEQLTNKFETAAACLILAFREKLKDEGETSVVDDAGVPIPQDDAILEFKCKYCQFPFSLARDRKFHQKICEDKPKKIDNNNNDGEETSSRAMSSSSSSNGISNNNNSKRMKPSADEGSW